MWHWILKWKKHWPTYLSTLPCTNSDSHLHKLDTLIIQNSNPIQSYSWGFTSLYLLYHWFHNLEHWRKTPFIKCINICHFCFGFKIWRSEVLTEWETVGLHSPTATITPDKSGLVWKSSSSWIMSKDQTSNQNARHITSTLGLALHIHQKLNSGSINCSGLSTIKKSYHLTWSVTEKQH